MMRQGYSQRRNQTQGRRRLRRQIPASVAIKAENDARLDEAVQVLGDEKAARMPSDEAWTDNAEDRPNDLEGPDQSWDRELVTNLATLPSLRDLCPPVQFSIAPDGTVSGRHARPQPDANALLPVGALRRAVTEAIAKHLHIEEVLLQLVEPGAWVGIPALAPPVGTNPRSMDWPCSKKAEYLVHLCCGIFGEKVARDVAHRGLKMPAYFYRFGIRLPSDDVITPFTLLDTASTLKRTTRASALRMMDQRPSLLAGESWTDTDWAAFRKTQSNATGRRR
jgi:hypothetical protein